MTINPVERWLGNPNYRQNLKQFLDTDCGKTLLDLINYYGFIAEKSAVGVSLFENMIIQNAEKAGVASVIKLLETLSRHLPDQETQNLLNEHFGSIEETEEE
jgi:hypothetical protein